MGNPNTGEIYEGMLRDEDDVPLNKEQAAWLKGLPLRERMSELKTMAAMGREEKPPDAVLVSEPPPNVSATRPLPRYKCHKEVSALKIKTVESVKPTLAELERILDSKQESPVFDAAILTPEDERYAPFGVREMFVRKHAPFAGGYFVIYDDGYQSYSPAKAFEDGYTLVEGD